MAKIPADLLFRFRVRRLDRLEALVAFEREFAPIASQEATRRAARAADAVALRTQGRLFRLAVDAGMPSDAAARAKSEELARIEERFVWKRRALAQSEKRFLVRRPDASAERFRTATLHLDAACAAAIARVEARHSPAADAIRARERFDRAAGLAATRDALRTAAIEKTEKKRLQAIETRSRRAVAKGEARIAELRAKLAPKLALASTQNALLSDELLRLDDLSMHFGGLKAVDRLSFTVKKGEIFGLIGPNGAGKTTVFNCITRFYRATRGTVWFRDRKDVPVDLGGYAVHDVVREGLVRTFQNVELIWELPVLENLLVAAHTLYRTGFFGQLLNVPRLRAEETVMRAKARRILADLGLAAYERMPVLGLPYGILKKIELARTLMVNPRLIILDEPAAGLNDAETEALAHTIRKIRDDYAATILLVEHDMGLVMAVCDRIAAISFGKLLAVGTPKEIQASPIVREAYLGGE